MTISGAIKAGGPRNCTVHPVKNLTGPTTIVRPERVDSVTRGSFLAFRTRVRTHQQVINPVYWCEVLR